MTPSNNFNVLPIYGSIDEQNARRWWVYGKVYPLFSPLGVLPPFQITREHIGREPDWEDQIFGYYLQSGNDAPVAGGDDYVYIFNVTAGDKVIYRRLMDVTGDHLKLLYLDGGDNILEELGEDAPGDGELYCEQEGQILVLYPGQGDDPTVFLESAPTLPVQISIQNLAGIGVGYTRDALLLVTDGKTDHFICNSSQVQYEGMEAGCYYLRLFDAANNVWFSDVFVWKENVSDLLMLEWWDNQDFEMDAGRILYNLPGGGTYKNRLYLASDIAKPEYTFDEEGETRDGYFFPTKMISEKRYRFSFWAPEYLLDALRFVRMADNIRITHKGHEFAPDTFLITPEWQAEGDLAAVDAEFETDTVAKKINFVK